MKNYSTQTIASAVCCVILFISNHSAAQNFTYPETPKQPVTDTIFGKVIVDNYRWLEDVSTQQVQHWR